MKSIRSVTLLNFAMGSLLAICFNSGLASAQTFAGKFTLPFEARWGSANLPAGDYSLRVDGRALSGKVLLFQGAKQVAYIVNQSYDTTPRGQICLVVEKNSAGNFVRDLNLPGIGMVLHYAPQVDRKSVEREHEIAQIPVATGTK
jgi:hypothetical protein